MLQIYSQMRNLKISYDADLFKKVSIFNELEQKVCAIGPGCRCRKCAVKGETKDSDLNHNNESKCQHKDELKELPNSSNTQVKVGPKSILKRPRGRPRKNSEGPHLNTKHPRRMSPRQMAQQDK